MTTFCQEKVFVLRRVPYREQHYLIDVLHREWGYFRASARITRIKGLRDTNALAYFQEVLVKGQRQGALASIWSAEVVQPVLLPLKQQFYVYYLNEILLRCLPMDDPAPQVYDIYRQALLHPCGHLFRQVELALLMQLGLLPSVSGVGNYYVLSFTHGAVYLVASATDKGFSHDLVSLLQQHNWGALCRHRQIKALFQAILANLMEIPCQTRNVTQALRHLVRCS